jgi:hypothetical protein
MLISLMRHAIYSVLYVMVLEWRPIFPFHKRWAGGGCQETQARPFANRL